MPGGAVLFDPVTSRVWALIDDGEVARFGGVLAWAWRAGASGLDVLVEGAEAAGLIAARAAEMAAPPGVWRVSGRDLMRASPVTQPRAEGPVPPELVSLLQAHGADVVVEAGLLRGEVLGLEVARVVEGRVEVGVGRYDRAARLEMRPGEDIGAALDEVVAAVRARRRAGAPTHPANQLARSRWLRSVLCARPQLIGARELAAVSPPLPWSDLPDAPAAPCVGVSLAGNPLMVVCSVGVDLDLVPTAAHARLIHRPDADLTLAVPEGDDLPVTLGLAGMLARPARVVSVDRAWDTYNC